MWANFHWKFFNFIIGSLLESLLLSEAASTTVSARASQIPTNNLSIHANYEEERQSTTKRRTKQHIASKSWPRKIIIRNNFLFMWKNDFIVDWAVSIGWLVLFIEAPTSSRNWKIFSFKTERVSGWIGEWCRRLSSFRSQFDRIISRNRGTNSKLLKISIKLFLITSKQQQ